MKGCSRCSDDAAHDDEQHAYLESEAAVFDAAREEEDSRREARIIAATVRALAAEMRTAPGPTPATSLPLLVDTDEAARLLGLTPAALRSRVKRGQVPQRCIRRTGTRRGRGGNSGRLQFIRAELLAAVSMSRRS